MRVIDLDYIDRLVEEGRRVGKTPWSCSMPHEFIVFSILNPVCEIKYPQESYQETVSRRKKEGRE